MPRQLFVPTFNGSLPDSAVGLSDFFLIREESAVPVETFTIIADGERFAFPVEAGRYKTALFLLYCAVLSHSGTYFAFAPFFQKYTAGYYGHQILVDAARKGTEHTAVRLLMSRGTIDVELTLRAGYTLPENKGRTLQELIEFGWQRYPDLGADTPAPLVRQAVRDFLDALRDHALPVVATDNPNIWPSQIWVERTQAMAKRLNSVTAIAA